jgi:hypothetical protein
MIEAHAVVAPLGKALVMAQRITREVRAVALPEVVPALVQMTMIEEELVVDHQLVVPALVPKSTTKGVETHLIGDCAPIEDALDKTLKNLTLDRRAQSVLSLLVD